MRMRVGARNLAASVLIWRFEGRPPFRQGARETLDELNRRHEGATFAVSRLSWLECRVKPLRDGDRRLLARYAERFAGGVRVVELDAEVVDRAASLRARHGLRTPDALQAASALHMTGASIFITGEPVFERVPGLHVRLVKPQGSA
jgi:predicted nucleic acid-binding protein